MFNSSRELTRLPLNKIMEMAIEITHERKNNILCKIRHMQTNKRISYWYWRLGG